MKIFGKTLFENKKITTEVVNVNDGKMSFSTPFFKIGKGDSFKISIPSYIINFGIRHIIKKYTKKITTIHIDEI